MLEAATSGGRAHRPEAAATFRPLEAPVQKVLVVDDDPHLREVVRYALTRGGFTVTEASSGVEALRLYRAGAPDLVVLDVVMPELDGIETCRELRKLGRTLIVFLSSREDRNTIGVRPSLRSSRQVSMPSSSGMTTSSTTRAGAPAR